MDLRVIERTDYRWHGAVTDPSAFFDGTRFHRLVAKAQNASLGRWENLWSSDKTSEVLLVSDADVLEKMAYTIANPTVAGLVRSPHEWPGVISHRFGQLESVEMPDVFFDDEGELPEEVCLEFVRPAIFPEFGDEELSARLREAVATRVQRTRKDMQLRSLPFLGRTAVLRQAFSATPRTPAPRRNPSPRIASKSTPARIRAIQRMLAFVKEYRVALLSWRAGNRNVTFPAGTYALRIHAGIACAQAP
jgi:hypothetical protein